MKKTILIACLVGGFSFVSRAAEITTGAKQKEASITRTATDVTICRSCANGNQVCGTGSTITEARASLNFAVKAGC